MFCLFNLWLSIHKIQSKLYYSCYPSIIMCLARAIWIQVRPIWQSMTYPWNKEPGLSSIHHANRGLRRKLKSRQVEDLCYRGLIEPADSPWNSPAVLASRKDGKWMFCEEYHTLNNATWQGSYPLPRIDESRDALCGSKYFSTVDIVSGYQQAPLRLEDRRRVYLLTEIGFETV